MRLLPTASPAPVPTSGARSEFPGAVGLFLALSLVACASKPAEKVATSMNAYDFREARYEERCLVPAPFPDCEQTRKALATWKKHLLEANDAVKNGGKCPLQLRQIAADEKEAARGH